MSAPFGGSLVDRIPYRDVLGILRIPATGWAREVVPSSASSTGLLGPWSAVLDRCLDEAAAARMAVIVWLTPAVHGAAFGMVLPLSRDAVIRRVIGVPGLSIDTRSPALVLDATQEPGAKAVFAKLSLLVGQGEAVAHGDSGDRDYYPRRLALLEWDGHTYLLPAIDGFRNVRESLSGLQVFSESGADELFFRLRPQLLIESSERPARRVARNIASMARWRDGKAVSPESVVQRMLPEVLRELFVYLKGVDEIVVRTDLQAGEAFLKVHPGSVVGDLLGCFPARPLGEWNPLPSPTGTLGFSVTGEALSGHVARQSRAGKGLGLLWKGIESVGATWISPLPFRAGIWANAREPIDRQAALAALNGFWKSLRGLDPVPLPEWTPGAQPDDPLRATGPEGVPLTLSLRETLLWLGIGAGAEAAVQGEPRALPWPADWPPETERASFFLGAEGVVSGWILGRARPDGLLLRWSWRR